MKLYISVCQDRHIDPVVRVYDSLDKAIAYAKSFVDDMVRHPEDIEESNIDGWLYHCTYSCEGDGVFVVEDELNRNEYDNEA